MDAITSLFRGPRASDAFVLKMVMEAPWSVDVRDEAPLTIASVVAGSVTVTSPTGDVDRVVRAGQVIVVRGPDHYRFFEGAAESELTVLPGQQCVDRRGRSVQQPLMQGVRTWGNDADGSTTVLIGTYETMAGAGAALLALLPHIFVVDAELLGPEIVNLLGQELVRDVPGQDVVLDRLLDLLTVAALRAWFDQLGDSAPSWWRASSDSIIGPALRLLQLQPEHPWTIAMIASEVGVSRATLARRFTEVVGAPPMAYLTQWRMDLAADLLLEPGRSLDGVAREVGYGSGFALSTAFKRWHGRSPSEHRRVAGAA